MNKQEKIDAARSLSDSLKGVTTVVVTDYKGLNVKSVTDLRRRLTQKKVHFKVVKNTLARRSFQEMGLKDLLPYLKESSAIAFTDSDAVSCAKILVEFSKDNDKLKLKAGWLTGKLIPVEGIKALADLPSREVLLAQVAYGMQSPIAGFVRVLAGPLGQLVRVVEAVRKKKSEQSS